MKVNFNTVHFKADKKLINFITEKIEKTTDLYDGIISSDVTLKLNNNEGVGNKVVEIRLIIRGYDLFAKKQNKTFEEATDNALEAIKKQLTKHKEKQRK